MKKYSHKLRMAIWCILGSCPQQHENGQTYYLAGSNKIEKVSFLEDLLSRIGVPKKNRLYKKWAKKEIDKFNEQVI